MKKYYNSEAFSVKILVRVYINNDKEVWLSKRSFIALLLLSLPAVCLAQGGDDVVRVLSRTSSTNTLVVNKGLLDGVRAQSKAHFILLNENQDEKDEKDKIPKQLDLGQAEAVKVFNGYSIWQLKQHPQVEIQENQKLILREFGTFYTRQPDLKVRRQRVMGDRRNVENSLSKKSDRFEKGLSLEEWDEADPVDKVLLEQHEWAERESYDGEKQAVPHEIKPNLSEVTDEDFKDAYKGKRFGDLVKGEVKENNTNPIDRDQLYRNNKFIGTGETTYKALADDRYQRKLRADAAITQQEKKGPSWSDDMSDRELINFVKKNGVAHEEERRLYLMNKQYTMEATVSLGYKINDSTTTADTTTSSQLTRDLAVGLEYFLGTRYKKLDHFSIEGEFRRGQAIAAAGTYNATVTSTTFGANAFWYPFTYPTELEKNLVFLGLGFKKGNASLATSRSSQDYSVTVFPVFEAGIRYHFANNIGLRLMSSLESFNLTPVDSTVATVDTLPNTVSFYDMKIIGGVSYYF